MRHQRESDRRSRDGAFHGRGAVGRLLAAVTLVFVAAGCEGLLEVEDDPDVVGGDAVEGEGAFDARFVGAIADFQANYDEFVVWTGLFSDELAWGGTGQGRRRVDERGVQPENPFLGDEIWQPLQVAARSTASLAGDIQDGAFPGVLPSGTDSEQFARVSMLAGYTRVAFADMFCTAAFDGSGPELTAQETYARAESFFTQALEASGAAAETRDAARVGRARVRLMMGDTDGALADAQQVTEGFEFEAEHSGNTNNQENAVWGQTVSGTGWTVDPAFRDVTIDDTGIADPRVEVEDTGQTTFNGSRDLVIPVKYDDRGANIRVASWFEAQYIIAEIQGGQQAVDIINDLRSRQGIEEEFDEGGDATEQEILAKILEERSRTLFIEGHRIADLRRFRERHGIDRFPDTPGDDVCLPLPDAERDNNPDI